MSRIEVKSGDKFGAWEIVKEAERRKSNRYYLCKCECGTEREIFRGSLIMSRSKSCGCKENPRNSS